MTKICPKCGKSLPDEAKFCMDCGYTLNSPESNGFLKDFSFPTLFIILIISILIIGGIFILTSDLGNDNSSADEDTSSHAVDLTISDVDGWDNTYDGKTSYSLSTNAIFNSVPGDMKGYNVKTTYYDANDSEIGHETETLENIYYESSYPLSFGYYTTYKIPNPDHVKVEIIKNGEITDSYTEHIDTNKISYLN